MANATIQSPEPPVELLPSHKAAAKNDIETLSQLIREKAPLVDPSTKETPLHAAAKTGSTEALKWLVKNRVVDLDSRSTTGYTPAHLAAVYGHLDSLKLLLTYDPKKGKELASIGEDGGLNVLSLATLQGDLKMVSWLLENFPETAHVSNSNGDQIVHFAAAEGHVEILKTLVEKFGTEIVSRKDNRFTSPIFFAAQQGKVDVLDYLINELERDPVAKDKDGLTTVHAATQNERASTVKWLVNKLGPKCILEKTIDGATPLHMAAASGNTEILKFLLDNLENKKDVNVTDNINATPAHDAAEYGKIKTMLLLLKYGADISITDTENKTPYELALEQSHSDVAAMVADYRDNGPSALQAYEKKRARPTRDDKIKPRTSRQEAEELSSVIVQTAETLDTYKEKQLRRQESLKRMNEIGLNEDDEQNKRGRSRHQGSPQKADNDDDNIEHTLGPKGDLYTVPNKRGLGRSRVKGGRSHDVEDYISETASHRDYSAGGRGHHFRGDTFDEDPPYAAISHDTGSNYSRPSRVKHYQDSDSEISGLTGRSDYLYDHGHSNGFFPPGYNPMYPPSLPPGRGKRVKRPGSASSKGSRQSGSQYRGPPHPMGISPAQFGYNHPMYFGYPQMYPGYAQPGGLIAIPHQQLDPQGRPMYVPHPLQMQRLRQQQQQLQSRRKSLTDKKNMKKVSTESKPSPRKLHTDQNIGYGPGLELTDSGTLVEPKFEDSLHPPAPPISMAGGRMEANKEVLKFDSNFLMAKPGEANEIRHHAGTTLNPAKAKSKPYDGRYDEYIMTDSEEEYEVDEYHSVGFAAEVACILAIGCVAGLKGLSKMRRGNPSLPLPKPAGPVDRPSLSSAWDESYTGTETEPAKKKKGKKSRRNSVTELTQDPETFAGREEVVKTTWDKSNQKKQKKAEGEEKTRSADTEEPQSELLTAELQKQSYQSVSKALGEKILYDTIGARHSSMINIASSTTGSRMSLNASSADEQNDDDFGDAISLVHGMIPGGATKRKHHQSDPVSVDDMDQLLTENKEKRKKKKKEKRDKKAKRVKTREGSEEESEVIENKEAKDDDVVFEVGAGDSVGSVGEEEAEKENEKEMKKEKEREKKEQEKKEKEQKEREKKEKKEHDKREKEQREKEKKETEKMEKEKRERERKEKESVEKEQKDKEKKEKDDMDKERKEREKREKEVVEKEKKEKETMEKERKEKERELKIKEKKEKDAREKEKREKVKRDREEQRERERREKEARREQEREEKEKREKEEREKREKTIPARPAPPPPEDTGSSDDTNANKKKGALFKKSKTKQKQSPAQAPSGTSQAKPASNATPPSKSRVTVRAAEAIKAAASPVAYSTNEAEDDFYNDEPREVENKLYMFDTESESEVEEEQADVKLVSRQRKAPDPNVAEIEQSMKSLTDDLSSFLDAPHSSTARKPTTSSSGLRKKAPAVPSGVGIETDQTKPTLGAQSRSLLPPPGESREAEELGNVMEGYAGQGMQLGFGDDISAMAEEMHNFYQEENLHMYAEGSTPSLSQDSYTGIAGENEDERLVLVTKNDLERRLATSEHSNQAYVSPLEGIGGHTTSGNVSELGTQSSGVGGANKRPTHSIGVGGGVSFSEMGVQSSNQATTHSIGTQENAGYSSSFEQNVLNMLQGMNTNMDQMKSNPRVTQKEINQQELIQQQLIQSTIAMSLNDPEVMRNLLAMLRDQLKGDSKTSSVKSQRGSTAFDELQAQLLLAQEQQRQETKKHFDTQAEFQEYMRKQMEEQSKLQMMGIQSNFELYSKKMQEQFAEQQKRWDEELRKRSEEESKSDKKRKKSRDKRVKKQKKQRPLSHSSDSSVSDSDEGLVLPVAGSNKPESAKVPAIKTMHARIYTQNLFHDDDLKTESQVSIAKIKKKQEARGKLTRMDTVMKFDNAREAIRRYESKDAVTFKEDEYGTSDNEDNEEELVQTQQVRPVTLKRAEIKTQSGSGFTPARPAPAPPTTAVAGKVGRIRRIESGSEADQPLEGPGNTEGAGNELQSALKRRWNN